MPVLVEDLLDEDVDTLPVGNPRDNDNLGILALFHNRYTLGDRDHGIDDRDYSSWSEMEAGIRKQFQPVVLLPVYGYDHSGLSVSTCIEPTWWHYAWDGGRLGFIFATRERVAELIGWKRLTKKRLATLEQRLRGEVKAYDDYLV